mmetsp:Transcript_16354/g.19344  ORF Transcript_16354/g.19344 Transcript_16354/m.19344 type:complete len:496 (-) Transcript_16354:180-1667(-)
MAFGATELKIRELPNNNNNSLWTPSTPLSVPCANCRSSILLSFNFCNICGAPVTTPTSSASSSLSVDSILSPEIPQQSFHDVSTDDDELDENLNNNDEFDFSSIRNLIDSETIDQTPAKNETETALCRYFLKGKCRSGADCKFSHKLPMTTTMNSIGETTTQESNSMNKISITEESFIGAVTTDEEVVRAISALGLPPSSKESFETVRSLLEALRDQCRNPSDIIAANRARKTLENLLCGLKTLTSHHNSMSMMKSPVSSSETGSRNLYVHGFGPETDESGIETLFSSFCQVKCVVMKEVLNRTSRCVEGRYCFVWTAGVQQATTARNALHNYNLNGSILQVSFAKDRKAPLEESYGKRKDFHETAHMDASSLNPPSRNLFVANFPETFTPMDVMSLFSNYCEVKRVVMKVGYCFVWTGGVEQAVHTLNSLNGIELSGHILQVAYAKDKEANNHLSKLRHPPPPSVYFSADRRYSQIEGNVPLFSETNTGHVFHS